MKKNRKLHLAISVILSTPLVATLVAPVALADPSSGGDSAGPVSNSTVTIGGDSFAVDPRGGSLNYSFSFFKGNLNYGQTPFELSLQLQQTAGATYVGGFTDSDSHTHPFGVSVYMPTPLPKATLPGTSELDDAGAVWDLNLPSIVISTSQVSKFYGKNQISATVTLGNTSYQYLMTMPSATQSNYASVFTSQFLSQATPLYSKDATAPVPGFPALITFAAGNDGQTIIAQDKYGTRYVFGFTVLYGYKGYNVYDPTYNSSNDANADQLLVYRIQKILYANGQQLGFTYTDDFAGNTSHVVSVWDNSGNHVASVSAYTNMATIAVANQQGTLQDLYQINFTGADFRVSSITNLSNNRTISYGYNTLQAVPYSWNNQTTLNSISNVWTGQSTAIGYATFGTNNTYDAGCNQFTLGQAFVQAVNNTDGSGNLISSSYYDYGFGTSDGPNFAVPLASGSKTYGSGLNHWMDSLFYLYGMNQDSDGCNTNDMVNPNGLTYGTTITTTYPNASYNRSGYINYDALGRMNYSLIATGTPTQLTRTQYNYASSVANLVAGGSFAALPFTYGSPTQTIRGMNICTLNGVPLEGISGSGICSLAPTESKVYDAWGNPIQTTSTLGQLTEFSYLPASQTNPPNERLAQTVKTHSIGNNGASYVLETQTFQNLAIAPAGSGALETATLPTSNLEHHYDVATGSSYDYRSDTMGNYIGGNTANPALNGMIGQRGQTDLTGVSDVAYVNTNYTPGMTSFNSQSALGIVSILSGKTKSGSTATVNRGGSLVNFMGYPLQHTNSVGLKTVPTYDGYGRKVSETIMAGTSYAQTTTTAYDLSADLSLNANAKFSIRHADQYGNLTVQLFDFRQRHFATYRQLVNQSMVQTAGYSYDSANNLTSATSYGNGYQKAENYYYGPGTSLRVATVPNFGLASGRIVDGLNGNTLEFSYSPASGSPTAIGKIYGAVKITHTNNLSHLILSDALIDADAATAALAGFDVVQGLNVGMSGMSNNLWVSSGYAPLPLTGLYKAVGNLPQNSITPSNGDNLLEYNAYGYDEWNRRTSVKNYTFVNAGPIANAQSILSATTTTRTYNTSQRQVIFTLPQGQTVTNTSNLLNGMQQSTLLAGGKTTVLGGIVHDGVGRELELDDPLNGGKRTAGYDPTTGLLVSSTDAYGNSLALSYDPVSFMLTQSVLNPAAGGGTITVNRSYDSHLRPTQVADNQGNTYGASYAASGLPSTSAISLAAYPSIAPFQYAFNFDNYADLTHVSDPFLPFAYSSSQGCAMVQANQSNQGYDITRDGYGRVSQVSTASYHGVNKTFAYDSTTGMLANNVLAGIPQSFGCGDTGNLSYTTAYTYDDNLRPIGKTITQNNLAGSPAPVRVADLALSVSAPAKVAKSQVITYTATVKNLSGTAAVQTATGVKLALNPSGSASVGLGYTSVPAGCTVSGVNLACDLPDLVGKQQVKLTVKLIPTTAGTLANTIKASTTAIDPNAMNHALTASANVCATGTSCLAGSGVRYFADAGNVGVAATATFAQAYDQSGRIASNTRSDFYGRGLGESYSYDLTTHALTGYANNATPANATAAPPYDYLPTTGMVTQAGYTYDLYGNLTQMLTQGPSGSISRGYAYTNSTNPFQLSATQETRCGSSCSTASGGYTYDIAGNTVTDGYGRSYGYDAHGLLASVTLANNAVESYVRDGLGRIVERQLPALPGLGAGTVVEFGKARLNTNANTVSGLWQVDYIGGTVTYTGFGYINASDRMINETNSFFGIDDLARRPVGNIGYGTGSGSPISNTTQLSYGTVTNLQSPLAGFPAGLQQAAEFPDAVMGSAVGAGVATGLEIKGGYRAYDPVTGRFLQWDSMSPLGKGGMNGYAYAANDPINYWDPTGHYAVNNAQNYGSKPPESHHNGGFWGGLEHGLEHGAKSIYMTPYHWGKSMYEDAAHGRWAGMFKSLGKGLFNDVANTYLSMALGPMGDIVFSEFITTNASNIFTGRNPFSAHVPFKGGSYEVGYQLGEQTAAAGEMATIAIVTMGAGEVFDVFSSVEIPELMADTEVAADGSASSSSQLSEDRIQAAEQEAVEGAPIGSDASIHSMSFDTLLDADVLDPDEFDPSLKPDAESSENKSQLRLKNWKKLRKMLVKSAGKELGKFNMADWMNANEALNSLSREDFIESGIDFSTEGVKYNWAKAFRSPKISTPTVMRLTNKSLEALHGYVDTTSENDIHESAAHSEGAKTDNQ